MPISGRIITALALFFALPLFAIAEDAGETLLREAKIAAARYEAVVDKIADARVRVNRLTTLGESRLVLGDRAAAARTFQKAEAGIANITTLRERIQAMTTLTVAYSWVKDKQAARALAEKTVAAIKTMPIEEDQARVDALSSLASFVLFSAADPNEASVAVDALRELRRTTKEDSIREKCGLYLINLLALVGDWDEASRLASDYGSSFPPGTREMLRAHAFRDLVNGVSHSKASKPIPKEKLDAMIEEARGAILAASNSDLRETLLMTFVDALARLGRFDQAIEVLETSKPVVEASTDPNALYFFIDALVRLSESQWDHGDKAGAIKSARRALAMTRRDGRVIANANDLGGVLRAFNHVEDGESALKILAMLETTPEGAVLKDYGTVARTFDKAGRRAEARETLLRGLAQIDKLRANAEKADSADPGLLYGQEDSLTPVERRLADLAAEEAELRARLGEADARRAIKSLPEGLRDRAFAGFAVFRAREGDSAGALEAARSIQNQNRADEAVLYAAVSRKPSPKK